MPFINPKRKYQSTVCFTDVNLPCESYGVSLPKKRRLNRTKLNLLDLPIELLMKIITYLDLKEHHKIRLISKCFNCIYTEYMKHYFKVNFMETRRHLLNKSLDVIIMYDIIKASTEYFTLFKNYQSAFTGGLLALYQRINQNHGTAVINELQNFIKHFYKMIESMTIARTNSPLLGLLYMFTLFNLLKRFKNCLLITNENGCLHIAFEVELIFLGIMWSYEGKRINNNKRNDLLFILCEILCTERFERSNRRIWKHDNILYIFGITQPDNKSTYLYPFPYTKFEFTVYAPECIKSMIRTMLQEDEKNIEIFKEILKQEIPIEGFIVDIKIECKSVVNWGCGDSIYLEIRANGVDDRREQPQQQNNGKHSDAENSLNNIYGDLLNI